jgi:hypothetical protein
MKIKPCLCLTLLAILLLASGAAAQPVHQQPTSVLIYPLFDSTPGAGTLVCVTNTNDSNTYCPDRDYRAGDTLVHFQYVGGEDCLEFDRYEFLSPGDTLCVITDRHNPIAESGYLAVSAVDPVSVEKMSFNHLIGSAIVVQSDLNFLWSYTPYPFRCPVISAQECFPWLTDIDADGAMDFDGSEYREFPRTLYLDSFFEEREGFGNQLTLMSTAGQDYVNELDVRFWNNVETMFSRTFKFVCWWSGPLGEISRIATSLGGDEEEMGHPPLQTGWLRIEGNRILDLAGNPVDIGDGYPPVLGVFAQYLTGTDFASGRALQHSGIVDGLEILNGNGQ